MSTHHCQGGRSQVLPTLEASQIFSVDFMSLSTSVFFVSLEGELIKDVK
jgi:hypothetical protein